jgi:lipopolysaccharide/colanic/teichoic acid biosynthesis glycosyltransferase
MSAPTRQPNFALLLVLVWLLAVLQLVAQHWVLVAQKRFGMVRSDFKLWSLRSLSDLGSARRPAL